MRSQKWFIEVAAFRGRPSVVWYADAVPDGRLRRLLCDDAGQVRCPSCIALQRVDLMKAMQRDPLVACMLLACGHAWHARFDGDTPRDVRPCDCPR